MGQQITIEASPNRIDPPSCYLQTILAADSTRSGFRRAALPFTRIISVYTKIQCRSLVSGRISPRLI